VKQVSQILLTFLTKVKPDKVAALKELLDDIANHLLENHYLAFTSLKRLHFASLILNEDATYGPDAPTALATANRHRILRRGRSYGHRPSDRRIDDGMDRGLHFLCLNSDIERQFEFVQHTWCNNPVFGGLNGEVDPLVGNLAQGDEIFTVQADPLRTRIHHLERFVTVKGGAYFFLPSLSALRYLASL